MIFKNIEESFYILKGFSENIYYSKEILFTNFTGNRKSVALKLSEYIKKEFIKNKLCNDVIVYGSLTFGGFESNSDVDLIGIDINSKKNKKYYFKVKNGNYLIDFTVRINNTKFFYFTRFIYRDWPKNPYKFINNNLPKCWGFIPKNVFKKDTLMNKLAQLDVIECLAAVSQVMFFESKQNNLYVTPKIISDKIKMEFSKTRQYKVFTLKNRWEKGLKNNCVENILDALNYCDFWVEKINNNKYNIIKKNGLRSKRFVYNLFFIIYQKLNPINLLYKIYLIKKRKFISDKKKILLEKYDF